MTTLKQLKEDVNALDEGLRQKVIGGVVAASIAYGAMDKVPQATIKHPKTGEVMKVIPRENDPPVTRPKDEFVVNGKKYKVWNTSPWGHKLAKEV